MQTNKRLYYKLWIFKQSLLSVMKLIILIFIIIIYNIIPILLIYDEIKIPYLKYVTMFQRSCIFVKIRIRNGEETWLISVNIGF